MEDNIFDIEFEADGKLYNGWVHPSIKLNPEGKPVSFHVVINHTSFGYLSFKNPRWHVNEDRPAELVQLIGEQIDKHYTNVK